MEPTRLAMGKGVWVLSILLVYKGETHCLSYRIYLGFLGNYNYKFKKNIKMKFY